jgi:hypothetical protein
MATTSINSIKVKARGLFIEIMALEYKAGKVISQRGTPGFLISNFSEALI